jgi:hypothetical protein
MKCRIEKHLVAADTPARLLIHHDPALNPDGEASLRSDAAMRLTPLARYPGELSAVSKRVELTQ